MRRLLPALAFLAIGAAAAAGAQTITQTITLATDKVLWCSSAFYWLSMDASEAEDYADADRYLAWSDELMARGTGLLRADRFSEPQIQQIVETYDEEGLEELGTDTARHDVATCPELVGG